MEKKKKEIILILCLFPVLAYVIYSNFLVEAPEQKPLKKATRMADNVQHSSKASSASGKENIRKLLALDEKLVQIQNSIAAKPWGRDPFNPAPTPMEAVGIKSDWKSFVITGLIPGPEGGVAIIDGEFVEKGDLYRGYRLIAIERTKITLEKDGQPFILTMPEE